MKGKKEKKKWGLIVFIIIIMVGTTFSFVFFGFSPQTDVVKYNGIKFVNMDNSVQGKIWITKINGVNAAFSFLPSEVENVVALDNFAQKLRNKPEIDATYDLNSTYKEAIALAQHQMSLTLAAYNIYLREGFTTSNPYNLPVITCSDATSNVPVIYFRYGNSTNINIEGDCIIAEASTNADFIKAKDRILYGILNVIKWQTKEKNLMF